jgi:hypothetical protein
MHSTTTALLPLATQVAICFNDKKPPRRCAMVAIDISKAFDSVDHTIFLKEVSKSTLNSNYIRWLAVYLRGRTASCSFTGAMSRQCKVKSGFPQGSVLSPDLWNFFVSDCPTPAEVQEGYADDLTRLDCDVNIDLVGEKLCKNVNEVVVWSERKNLVIAPSKSEVILFTPDSHQSSIHPQVFIGGQLIPLNKQGDHLIPRCEGIAT